MIEDRCECGQRVRCPMADQTVLGNRTGAPFSVHRDVRDGICYLTVCHLEDGTEGLPFRCAQPTVEEERALRQLHMLGSKP
jgi:hypothetical protein